jgi:hypothetical protein
VIENEPRTAFEMKRMRPLMTVNRGQKSSVISQMVRKVWDCGMIAVMENDTFNGRGNRYGRGGLTNEM